MPFRSPVSGIVKVNLCRCPDTPDALSYTDEGYDELIASLRLVEDVLGVRRYVCPVCAQAWVGDRMPFMHVDVDVIAKDGVDFRAYLMERRRSGSPSS